MDFINWFNANQGFTSAILAVATLLISIVAIFISINLSRKQNLIALMKEYSPIIDMLWKIESLSHRFFVMLSSYSPDDSKFLETVEGFNAHNNFGELLDALRIITTKSEYVLSKKNHDSLSKICSDFYLLDGYVYHFANKKDEALDSDRKEALTAILSRLNGEIKSLYAKLIEETRMK